jgi:hypothetical protein
MASSRLLQEVPPLMEALQAVLAERQALLARLDTSRRGFALSALDFRAAFLLDRLAAVVPPEAPPSMARPGEEESMLPDDLDHLLPPHDVERGAA